MIEPKRKVVTRGWVSIDDGAHRTPRSAGSKVGGHRSRRDMTGDTAVLGVAGGAIALGSFSVQGGEIGWHVRLRGLQAGDQGR